MVSSSNLPYLRFTSLFPTRSITWDEHTNTAPSVYKLLHHCHQLTTTNNIVIIFIVVVFIIIITSITFTDTAMVIVVIITVFVLVIIIITTITIIDTTKIVVVRSEEEVSWRRGPPVTYFCPALDPPLDGSGRKTTTLVRDLEYFIHTKFHQNP